MSVHLITQRPYSQGSQPPPYIDGGVITHLTGAIEGAQFDADANTRAPTVPVRDTRAAGAGGGTGARAILVLPDGLVCDLGAAVGLGGLDKGAVAAQTAYAVRAYADLSGGVVGLMAVETGTVVTLPAGIVWESPILAAVITDNAVAAKPFADLLQGWQQWTELANTPGVGNVVGTLVDDANNAAGVQVDLRISNGGNDPAAVAGVREVYGHFAMGSGALQNFGQLRYVNPAAGRLLQTMTEPPTDALESFSAHFADGLANPPHFDLTAFGDANTFGSLLITAIRLGW
jgi:hypothetical protein